MTEIARALARKAGTAKAKPGALESVIKRVERRRQHRRIATVSLALLIGGASVLAAYQAVGGHIGGKQALTSQSSSERSSARSDLGGSNGSPIDLQPGETFLPGAAGQPSLTPTEAWVGFARGAGATDVTSLPPDVSVQLGQLTIETGDMGPDGRPVDTKHMYLVYGYSWQSCPVVVGGDQAASTSETGSTCVEWRFLDANTGEQILDTWQQ